MSKLNRHFPYTITVMIANTPWYPRSAKKRLWKRYPEDVRPSLLAGFAAHTGTAIELVPPAVLLLSGGGWIGTTALVVMIVFHVHILSTFPFGVPLEWNVFMLFGLVLLFGAYADVPLATAADPLLLVTIAVIGLLLPITGNPTRTRSRSCRGCATTPATGPPACGCSEGTPERRRPRASATASTTPPPG